MLMAWKQKEGCEATYTILYYALRHKLVKCNRLAELFCCEEIEDNASPQSYIINTESFLYYALSLCEYSKERLCQAFALNKSFIFLALEDWDKIIFREQIFTRIFALKNRWLKNAEVGILSDVQNDRVE